MRNTKSITYVGYRITERCNKNCVFCFAREAEIAKDQTLEEVEKFLQNLKRAKITAIGVMGGEPLLRLDIVEVLALIRKYEFESILSTNATLITSGFLKKASKLIDFLSISLDASTPEANDTFRGVGQFAAAVNMIKAYDPKEHKFKLKVNTVVHRQNINESIDRIPELFERKPIIWKLLQYTPRLAGKRVKDRFEISLKEFKEKGESLKVKYPDVRIALRTYTIDENYDLLILRPNGNLEINHGEYYRVVGNANRDEIADVIDNIWGEQETYFNENWDEFKESYR